MRRLASTLLAATLAGGALVAAPASAADAAPVLNEIRIDQPSTDNDEYVEIAGDPGTSLDGLTHLVIGDGTGGSGVVESITDLSGATIPPSGYLVVAEETFTLGTADVTASLNFENSDNVTHALVRDFTGSPQLDLDSDDELDLTPWTEVLDAVGLLEGPGDQLYATVVVGPDGSFVPGHVYRCQGWQIGGFTAGSEDTPGAANCADEGTPAHGGLVVESGGPGPDTGECGDPATPIHEVQGGGDSSPLDGTTVTVEAVVTGVFPGLDGFSLQEEDADADGDPATSDGIFVFDPGVDARGLAPGDVVRTSGDVDEFFGETQIGLDRVDACGTTATATAAVLDLPLPVADRERVEGMLVTVPDTLHVSDLFTTARFGDIGLAEGGVLRQGTDVAAPGAAANAVEAQNQARLLVLDDGSTAQNPDPAPWFKDEKSADPSTPTSDPDPVVRAGDTVEGLTGVIRWSRGSGSFGDAAYRLHPTAPVVIQSRNPRPGAPAGVGGFSRIASFNVLNYFNGDGAGGGFPTPRGASDPVEFADQRAKIIAAILGLDADVVGLMEIENDGFGSRSAIADLVAGLNDATAPGTYAFVDPGTDGIGTDAIAVGMIYRPATAHPVGQPAVLDSSVDPRFNDDRNRPALARTFSIGGRIVTVAVNHLKSKGSPCADIGDPDIGDGQGNCNLTRTTAAEALADWLADRPTQVGTDNALVIGDMNAYAQEDPIEALRDAGYTDLLAAHVADGDAYTFVFDGRRGRLDHALASPSLVDAVTGATVWHVNADEVSALTYDTRFEDLIAPGPYASSDHDPVVVGLAHRGEGKGVAGAD